LYYTILTALVGTTEINLEDTNQLKSSATYTSEQEAYFIAYPNILG